MAKRPKKSLAPPSFQIQFVSPDGTTTPGPLLVSSGGSAPIRRFNEKAWDKDQTVSRFLQYLEDEDRDGLEAVIRALNRLDCWPEAMDALLVGPSPNLPKGYALISFWNTYGLHSIPRGLREQLTHLVDAFRYLLPSYSGMGLTLYRGELESRYTAGIYGIAWTPILAKAQEFASRRSPDEGTGVVLQIDATAEMIVAAVRDHFMHTVVLGEDEYLLDPRTIRGKVALVV
jgi:hypothetical protein